MDKFWEWMIKQDYCKLIDKDDFPPSTNFEDISKYYINDNYDEFTNTMLIGYMIEYILQYCPVHSLFIPASISTTTILSYYNYLKWFIEEELGKKRNA